MCTKSICLATTCNVESGNEYEPHLGVLQRKQSVRREKLLAEQEGQVQSPGFCPSASPLPLSHPPMSESPQRYETCPCHMCENICQHTSQTDHALVACITLSMPASKLHLLPRGSPGAYPKQEQGVESGTSADAERHA